jgi:hypothetical protein
MTESPLIEYTPGADWRLQFDQLAVFVVRWHGQDVRSHGLLESAMQDKRIPKPLRSLYLLAGNSPQLTTQNRLLMPAELQYRDDGVVFYEEAQRLCWWAAGYNGENPQVVQQSPFPQSPSTVEDERLCGFLYQLCVYEAFEGADYRYYRSAYCAQSEVSQLLSRWVRAPLSPWRWPSYPIYFYCTDEALALVAQRGDGQVHFQCGAKRLSALSFMQQYMTNADEWEVF